MLAIAFNAYDYWSYDFSSEKIFSYFWSVEFNLRWWNNIMMWVCVDHVYDDDDNHNDNKKYRMMQEILWHHISHWIHQKSVLFDVMWCVWCDGVNSIFMND